MNQQIRLVSHILRDFLHSVVGCFIPIKENKIFFDSYPDYSDNCRAMSDYLVEHSDYDIYWAVNKIPTYPTNPKIHFVEKKHKWAYIYHSLSSRFLFSTHGAFSWSNKKRNEFVCFWHGTMLKKVACLQDPIRNKYYNKNVTYYSAPSNYYTSIFAQSFGRPIDEIKVTGYPRIDFLINNNKSVEKLNINLSGFKKVIMYLPTFRQPIGGGYTDSSINIFKDDIIDFTSSKSLNLWNDYFKKLDILLIVKPHPSDKNQLDYINLSNISIIPHQTLLDNDIQLYSILHFADALITDYSSVFCDYLVLDRPIGFILSDISEYAQGRGFVFDNPIEMLPGTKIFDENEFRRFVEDVAKNIDPTKSMRAKLQPMYNTFTHGCFCERIAKMINLKMINND